MKEFCNTPALQYAYRTFLNHYFFIGANVALLEGSEDLDFQKRLFHLCDMPYLVRGNLFIGNIGDAADVLQHGSDEITHLLSVLSSTSMSFFSEWRSQIVIPTEEIRKVYVGGSGTDRDSGDGSKSSLASEKVHYSLEKAGKDLKFMRMAVPLRDTENEDLLDYLEVCLDFIDQSRKEGSILVHCFAGVSRSAAIITAYLMITEQLSEEGLNNLGQS